MLVSVLEMNGEQIKRSLNYVPADRGYYNVVAKDMKMRRAKTAEEAVEALRELEKEGVTHAYVKVPSALAETTLASLRIA